MDVSGLLLPNVMATAMVPGPVVIGIVKGKNASPWLTPAESLRCSCEDSPSLRGDDKTSGDTERMHVDAAERKHDGPCPHRNKQDNSRVNRDALG